ncbi:hypothetical protein HDK64DRAFT_273270 [Phyllosticta capitalensis]
MVTMGSKHRLRRLYKKLRNSICRPLNKSSAPTTTSPTHPVTTAITSPAQPNRLGQLPVELASTKALQINKSSAPTTTSPTHPATPATNSPAKPNILGQLPVELLLEIDDCLNDGDSLALGATCRSLRQLPTKRRDPDNATAKTFGKQLEWDRVCRLVSTETQAQRFCEPCRDLHSEEYFSKDQWNGSPWTRVCRGRQRVYRVCKHLALGYDQLCNMENYGDGLICEQPDNSDGPFLSCRGEAPKKDVCAYSKFESRTRGVNLQRMGKYFVHICEARLPNVYPREKLPIRRLHDRLAHDVTSVCPHVRYCDLDLNKMTSKVATLQLCRESDSLHGEEVRGSCTTESCGAEFTFGWENQMPYGFTVRFTSKRQFELDELNGSIWLSNSEETEASQLGKLSGAEYRKKFFAN